RARRAEADARHEAERARADAEEARRIAEDANRAKDDFLAVVSHELRTPLQAILGFSDLLGAEIAGPLAPRQHEYVRRVQTAGGHLLDTIENLLGFARAQSGKEVVVATPFDAAATVAQVLDIAAPLAARRQIEIAQEGATAGIDVISDERKVRQIVTNLVGNAVKFTERGRVAVDACVVDTADAGQRLRITVRDTGIGIPPEQLARVFDPFVQVSGGANPQTTTRPAAGTGLGLSIVRQLTRLLGGEVSVTSAVGEGSEFVVDLPRVHDAAPRRGATDA
ncbi:MAG TPA: HAMP domain-containing sensor histidine kinase, partial [Gemmatirosa sp.]